jgi:hypothetical protein
MYSLPPPFLSVVVVLIIAAPKGEEEDEIPPANILKHLRDRGISPAGWKKGIDSRFKDTDSGV